LRRERATTYRSYVFKGVRKGEIKASKHGVATRDHTEGRGMCVKFRWDCEWVPIDMGGVIDGSDYMELDR